MKGDAGRQQGGEQAVGRKGRVVVKEVLSELQGRPFVLAVAGSDPGGGAGIQADLKTFQELGVYGMAAVTAVTAQNSTGIRDIYPMAPEAVAAQMDAVLADIGADAVKTGMLAGADIAAAVAEAAGRHAVRNLVVDPVLSAKHGTLLLHGESALDILRTRLLPLARVVTPNIPEACAILGISESEIADADDMAAAARALRAFGPACVVLKGGHLPDGGQSPDVVSDASGATLLPGLRLSAQHTHGTGCTFASALAAHLALGYPPLESARAAKRFTALAIEGGGPTGSGVGSLWHAAGRAVPVRPSQVAQPTYPL